MNTAGLAALAGLAVHERRRLVETVRHYLDTGSIKATAEALYCHRNTVVKRLDRFQELAGVDLRIPRQAALVLHHRPNDARHECMAGVIPSRVSPRRPATTHCGRWCRRRVPRPPP
ncbi:helix-turn-helix domain-containing protein [Streptomyces adustus]|uniref:helix-turn-helix domain-containing protein n=1 Tax=Streptomyces adustus TaxID=1609272 RepID=UPI003717EF43